MKTHLVLAWLSAVFSVACAADVKLPDAPVIPAPMPPAPSGVYLLADDDIYPVSSDTPILVRFSPPGILSSEQVKQGVHHWKTAGKWKSYEAKTPFTYFLRAEKAGRVEVEFFWSEGNEVKTKKALIDALHAPIPPPDPKPPEPKPPDPKPPEPVTSFRVILIHESGDTMTAAQTGVFYGVEVEDFLNKKCTDGRKGWFRRDKDVDVLRLPPVMQKMWVAVQPKVTVTPCVAVAVNEKVDIINLEPTPAAMIAKLNTYLGGK